MWNYLCKAVKAKAVTKAFVKDKNKKGGTRAKVYGETHCLFNQLPASLINLLLLLPYPPLLSYDNVRIKNVSSVPCFVTQMMPFSWFLYSLEAVAFSISLQS